MHHLATPVSPDQSTVKLVNQRQHYEPTTLMNPMAKTSWTVFSEQIPSHFSRTIYNKPEESCIHPSSISLPSPQQQTSQHLYLPPTMPMPLPVYMMRKLKTYQKETSSNTARGAVGRHRATPSIQRECRSKRSGSGTSMYREDEHVRSLQHLMKKNSDADGQTAVLLRRRA